MILSQDFRNAIFTLVAEDTPVCTLKFYTSRAEDYRPVLTATADNSNIYSTTAVVDLEDFNNIA